MTVDRHVEEWTCEQQVLQHSVDNLDPFEYTYQIWYNLEVDNNAQW